MDKILIKQVLIAVFGVWQENCFLCSKAFACGNSQVRVHYG